MLVVVVVVVEEAGAGAGAPVEGGGGAAVPNGFRSRRGSLLLEEARLTRVASFLLRRKSSRARCEAMKLKRGVGFTRSSDIRRVLVVVGCWLPNDNGGGQTHRRNTKEFKPTRILFLVGCAF